MRASYHTTGRSLALFARSVRQELYYDSFSDALVRFLEALTHQDDSGAPIQALQGTVLAASAVERGLAMCRYCKNCRLPRDCATFVTRTHASISHHTHAHTNTHAHTQNHTVTVHTTHTRSDDDDVRTSDAFFSLFSDLAGRY